MVEERTPRANAELLCKCPRPRPMRRGNLRVVVLEGPRMHGDMVEVVLEVTRNGQPVAVSNPFRFLKTTIAYPGMTHAQILRKIILDTVGVVAK